MMCKIISPQNKQEFKNISSVILPAFAGEMQILPGHAESFIKLQTGEIVLAGGQNNSLAVEDGICYVSNDKVLIIL